MIEVSTDKKILRFDFKGVLYMVAMVLWFGAMAGAIASAQLSSPAEIERELNRLHEEMHHVEEEMEEHEDIAGHPIMVEKMTRVEAMAYANTELLTKLQGTTLAFSAVIMLLQIANMLGWRIRAKGKNGDA